MSNILNSLGWALLHSVWQGALALLAVIIIKIATKNCSPAMRYTSYMLVLVGSLLAFLTSFAIKLDAGSTALQTAFISNNTVLLIPTSPLNETVEATTNQIIATGLPIDLSLYAPVIAVIWCVGFLLQSSRYAVAFILTQKLRHHGLIEPSQEWTNRFKTLILNAGLNETVKLHISTYITNPVTLGFIKPIVLVPIGFLTQLPQDQVEAILLHEIAHIRRYDYAVNLVQTAIKTIFFFHPAIHFISRQIDIEREQACDDLAVAQGRNPHALAKGLASLRLNLSDSRFTMAADGNSTPLMNRLKRLSTPSEKKQKPEQVILSILTALIIGSIYVGTAQAKPDSRSDQQVTKASNESIGKNRNDDYTFKVIRVKDRDIIAKISTDGRRWVKVGKSWKDIDLKPSLVNNIPAGMPRLPQSPAFSDNKFYKAMTQTRFKELSKKNGKKLKQFDINMGYYRANLKLASTLNTASKEKLNAKANSFEGRVKAKFHKNEYHLKQLYEKSIEQTTKASFDKETLKHEIKKQVEAQTEQHITKAKSHHHETHTNHNNYDSLRTNLYKQLLKDKLIKSDKEKVTFLPISNSWTANGILVPETSQEKYCKLISKINITKSKLTKIEIEPGSTHLVTEMFKGSNKHSQKTTYGKFVSQPIAPIAPNAVIQPISGPVPMFSPQDDNVPSQSHRFIPPTLNHHITAEYGATGKLWKTKHKGIDFKGNTGDPVYASAEGIVHRVKDDPNWGKHIILKHKDNYTTLYAHMDDFSVSLGQQVRVGQIIGTIGSTGRSTGPHLHFEVRKRDQRIDPTPYIF